MGLLRGAYWCHEVIGMVEFGGMWHHAFITPEVLIILQRAVVAMYDTRLKCMLSLPRLRCSREPSRFFLIVGTNQFDSAARH